MATRKRTIRFDEIGYWSELKLEIVRKYAAAYSTIMAAQQYIKRHVYIDAFAGAGSHLSRTTGEPVPGSPMIALAIEPKFSEYHLIDILGERADARGLCLLDPYRLGVDWRVLETAGRMKSIEVFYSFMIMDANRNVLWKNPEKVPEEQRVRMDRVWGDRSWRDAAYVKTPGLFGPMEEKAGNQEIVDAFRKRLREVAGFQYVPEALPMRNRLGVVIYYLIFASRNQAGAGIVQQIYDKYRNRGAR